MKSIILLNFKMKKITEKGFTLVEILLVIGIISILTVAIVVTINPGYRISQSRNDRRRAHLEDLQLSFTEYRSREGEYPECVEESRIDISECESDLVPDYMDEIPKDPLGDDCEYETGYFVQAVGVGRISLEAECAENEESVKIENR